VGIVLFIFCQVDVVAASAFGGNKRDPFVTLTAGAVSHKTETVKNVRDAKWDGAVSSHFLVNFLVNFSR